MLPIAAHLGTRALPLYVAVTKSGLVTEVSGLFHVHVNSFENSVDPHLSFHCPREGDMVALKPLCELRRKGVVTCQLLLV